MIGRVFGRLTVLGYSHTKKARKFYNCACTCGNKALVCSQELKTGDTKSCGCLRREPSSSPTFKHGLSGSRAYQSWIDMRNRCHRPDNHHYKNYGGRGIIICNRWSSFEAFFEDMGDRPTGLQLDRIDNDGNYEPSNCRWSTVKVNARNRTNNRIVTVNGETACLTEMAERYGINPISANYRLSKGWSHNDIFLIPVRRKASSQQSG